MTILLAGCATYRERVRRAVDALDEKELVELRAEMNNGNGPLEQCIALEQECASGKYVPGTCQEEALAPAWGCDEATRHLGAAGPVLSAARGRIIARRLGVRGYVVEERAALHEALRAAITGRWTSTGPVLLLLRRAEEGQALEDELRKEFLPRAKDYPAVRVQQRGANTFAEVSFGSLMTEQPALVERLRLLVSHHITCQQEKDRSVDGVPLLPAEWDLARASCDAPEPWRTIRRGIKEHGERSPALSAALRLLLRHQGLDLAEAPRGQVKVWAEDRSRSPIARLTSCPPPTRPPPGAVQEVSGVVCGEKTQKESHRSPQRTESSRVQYRDGKGTEVVTTTTQVGGEISEDTYRIWTVQGELELHFGTRLLRVPYPAAEVDERSGRQFGDRPERARDVLFFQAVDVANEVLAGARKGLLADLRRSLAERTDPAQKDELAAQLVLLGDGNEPQAIDYLRNRFSLPEGAAAQVWAGPR